MLQQSQCNKYLHHVGWWYKFKNRRKCTFFKKVYFCPSVTGTYVSMGKLMEQNFRIEKEKENFILKTQEQKKFDTVME